MPQVFGTRVVLPAGYVEYRPRVKPVVPPSALPPGVQAYDLLQNIRIHDEGLGSVLTTAPFIQAPIGVAVPGAFNVDAQNLYSVGATGAGNGILVGETGRIGGSQSGVSGTGAWNLNQFLTALSSGTMQVGDICYLYTGNYAPTTFVAVAGGGTSTGHGGAKIRIIPRPGHSPTIDYRASAGLGVTDRAVVNASGGAGCFQLDNAANYSWGDVSSNPLSVYGTGTIIWGATVTAPGGAGSEYINIRYGDDYSLAALNGGNGGIIKIESGSQDILIRGFQTIPGMAPRYANANWAAIYWLGTTDLRIENSLIVVDGTGGGYTIQNKRLGSATISDTLLSRLDGGFVMKAERITNHTWDNVIVTASGANSCNLLAVNDDTTSQLRDAFLVARNLTVTPESGGSAGNQCLGFGVQFSGGSPPGAGENNEITRCLINGGMRIAYQGSTIGAFYVHGMLLDYNQHRVGETYREFTTHNGLTNFINNATGFGANAPHSQNSIEVTPNFSGLDMYDPSTYAPTNPQTIGGQPVGAVVSNVGPAAIGIPLG